MYTDIARDHFAHPRNAGVMADAQGEGSQENPACGDLLKVFIKVDGGRITDIRFQAFGCSATIASGSMVTEMVRGKALAEALAVTDQAVSEALGGLPPNKKHCAILAAETLHQAVEDYRKRQEKRP